MTEQKKIKILAVETSCDETALSIVECSGGLDDPQFSVIAEALNSQIDLHKEYGGVYPDLAKREHQKALTPLLETILEKTKTQNTPCAEFPNLASKQHKGAESKLKALREILARETNLLEQFEKVFVTLEKPDIDYIAVTQGPGLEPALWVGINFARALSLLWDIPLIPTNHMEGHIASILTQNNTPLSFPACALLISGGHTELNYVKKWGEYKLIGQTRDDALGEAFDKVARLLDLPYPGGPEISKYAHAHRAQSPEYEPQWDMPRPMMHSGDYDFSFSGIKTAVLYKVREAGVLTDSNKHEIAREFEDAVFDVIIAKTKKALREYNIQSLIVGGGVVANKKLRDDLHTLAEHELVDLYLPDIRLATDNAVMIALAGYLSTLKEDAHFSIAPPLVAKGNLRL